jgi:hypothetical protein
MEESELRNTLAALHGELADRGQVDDDTRALLKTLTDDIHRLLDAKNAGESTSAGEPLAERTQDLVLKFGSDHPQLAEALNRVASALANMGI